MVTVAGDQLLWYIDTLSFVLYGKLITGAMQYLTYPENRTFSKTVFATHHLWFLPACLYVRQVAAALAIARCLVWRH